MFNNYDPMMEYYDDPSMQLNMMGGNPYMVQGAMDMDYYFDEAYLLSVGFQPIEINAYKNIMCMRGKFNRSIAMECGLNYQEADQLAYLHSFCQGKVSLDGIDNIVKHRKRLSKYSQKVGIQDLKISSVKEVPRVAVVYGIPNGPFAIYNSNNYKGMKMIYKVTNVTSKNIVVETTRVPALKYGDKLKLDGVLEIVENKLLKNNKGRLITLAVDKEHCRLCNRYLVVASLKRPEFHLGMYTIVCGDGTKLYVFAKSIGIKNTVGYNQSTQRIYQYGIFRKTIPSKLKSVGDQLYDRFSGVYSEFEPANDDYMEIDKERKDSDMDDELMGQVE